MGGQVRVRQVQLKDAYLGSMPWGSQDAFILASTNGYTPGGLGGLLGVASSSASAYWLRSRPQGSGARPTGHACTITETEAFARRRARRQPHAHNPALQLLPRPPPPSLAAAEREAERILGQAGLRASWLECSVGPSTVSTQDPCQKAPGLTASGCASFLAPVLDKFQDSVFGFAIHPVLASVYYEFALRRARRDDANFELPIILGCVMAHELGHLLLGSNSHSDRGIMLPRWEVNQVRQLMMGALLFTPEQSKLMRLEARARAERQSLASRPFRRRLSVSALRSLRQSVIPTGAQRSERSGGTCCCWRLQTGWASGGPALGVQKRR